ncbi:MAG TPA: carbamoyl-phosphate synthase (glutamine-hydrolyzing) large subunit [Spirochaetota bacterium]|nr:carbamoyl-phosphate synthase (glutamine-hydrolyzing) large subunit [Spirochaetota bacterium]HOL55932.1 carbamoyl-phosphate synthase (glutamine-hydrolyzing) large subunit [Spirochaetota bacterium]HPP03238.1 carbamoyl-phosphate synthase (glutamine-hydrolyzing) large subunit [Spirochaetota bacterium]
MPLYKDIKRVFVIGSGPIVIGQAAEFDYAGTQACKSLKEEGLEVILVNSNPATIMTDINMADRVYLEPLNLESLEKIIKKERPDGILPTLGGQTGLNLAVELSEAGVLEKYNVRLLGTPLETIKKAEDRELFKKLMIELGEPIPPSTIVDNIQDAIDFANQIGYPLIIRPAYTLGGLGGGIVDNEEDLINIAIRGLKNSRIRQILIEKSVARWKEIEYEVLRDSNDTCITVCNMENIDPVGIHTGDSIVIAPSQTLCDKEYHMLRSASLKIIKALGIEGGCNIQFGLNPNSFEYIVIEVNPRVSRSSALASKATGYPIAKVAAKIAVGLTLDEILNSVTKKTLACYEPTLDYVVAKIPRWPFDKFTTADRNLGTQMKATGEVMAIDRTIEGAIMKGIRSLEIKVDGPYLKELNDWDDAKLIEYLKLVDDRRLFVIFELLRRGYPIGKIESETKIDIFFLKKFENIIKLEKEAIEKLNKDIIYSEENPDSEIIDLIKRLKVYGFADTYLARLIGVPHLDFRKFRKRCNVIPVYKMVDTCAAEFEAATPYYYSCYEEEDEVTVNNKRKAIVLGSGPIRIGQGIEFDYCSVHSVWGLEEEKIESIIINNNPETVSTDFDTSDKLYFEPLNIEDVLNIIEKENPEGVIVQFGGQTALNLVKPLHDAGVKILGTSIDSIDIAEDRKRFNELLLSLGILQLEGRSVTSFDEALGIANKLGYPVLVRPSYVIGGHAMEIVYNEDELFQYMRFATEISPDYPVLIDKYLIGKEAEVDAISDGEDVFIPGIFEHIERAGIHSGDSMAVYPPFNLSDQEKEIIVKHTIAIGKALKVVGLMNIQFVISKGKIYCIEVNPRASRTVPIISKVTNIEMVNIATKIMMGKKLKDFGLYTGLYKSPNYWTIKAPVFSFDKLKLVETSLGPEMKSTGEVLGLGDSKISALYKAISAVGINIPKKGNVLLSIADKDKEEAFDIAKRLLDLGYNLFGTTDTYNFFKSKGLSINIAYPPNEGSPDVLELMKENKINLVINTPTKGKVPKKLGFIIRRTSVELKIPCITSLDTAFSIISILEEEKKGREITFNALNDYVEFFK